MIKKPSEGTYLGRIIKRAQYFFDSLASYLSIPSPSEKQCHITLPHEV